MEHRIPEPSGVVLPLLLRKKKSTFRSSSSAPSTSTWTASELQQHMDRISQVLLPDIQRQLQRGEEEYFEDTNAYGNIYKGWDDKDMAWTTAGGSGGGTPVPPTSTRRIPADSRWFSASSTRLWNRHESKRPEKFKSMAVPLTTTSSSATVGTPGSRSSTSTDNTKSQPLAPTSSETPSKEPLPTGSNKNDTPTTKGESASSDKKRPAPDDVDEPSAVPSATDTAESTTDPKEEDTKSTAGEHEEDGPPPSKKARESTPEGGTAEEPTKKEDSHKRRSSRNRR